MYTGKYSLYQQGVYKTTTAKKLSEQQEFLFNRALYGMSVYSVEEVQKMHKEKRKRIVKVSLRCQEILNVWKQELVNDFTNSFFKTFFWHSPLAKDIVEKGTFTDSTYTNTMSFQQLGVKRSDIIEKLIEEGILPNNFHQLQTI
jgi:predicted thioredoxin/glutaredoxin